MITREDLETLSSSQLHERAVDAAKAEGDIDWLWHILGSIPSMDGQLGELDDSGLDVASLVTAINGALRSDRTASDLLRSQYIEYLLEHF